MSRLEEIKEHVQGLMDLITDVDGNGVANLQVIYNDMIWLIERVQELEQQNKNYRKAIKECVERMNEGGAGTRSFVYERLIEVQELETTVDFYQSALRDADRRVQELEGTVKHAMKAIDNTEAVRVKLINAEQQNKRYRQSIEVAIHNLKDSDNLGVKFALGILEQALEGKE